MKDIKRLGCILIAVITSMMATSCLMDEIIGQAPIESVESELIAFGATLSWNDQDDLTTKSGAESYGNRIGNRILSTADSSMTLPMGVYVQNGIHSAEWSYGPATKGSVVSSKDGIKEFAVWANYKKSDTETMSYFSNVAYKKADDGIFYPVSDADEYYWPGAGTLNFYALANAPESGFTANVEDGALKSFSYKVPTNPEEQGDILLASASAAGNSNASVPLTFDHIMSAVNIKVGSIVEGEIRSITLTNVYNKGNYLVEQGVWVVDKTSISDFTVKMEGGKFVSTGKQAEGTPINTSDATFMFIPQNPGDDAEIIIEFYDNTTDRLYSDGAGAYKPALRARIAGDNWDKRKTINYMLSIDESFTLSIEPVGKKLDAHYVIGYANVTVDGVPNWEITATTSNNAEVTILASDDSRLNELAKQGFWTDYEVDQAGNKISLTDKSDLNYRNGYKSARGQTTWTGSGNVTNKLFYIFIPENIDDQDRQINLILRSTGSSSASTTKALMQKYPNWTAGGFGWEVVDDAESGRYGFKWTRKVAYVLKFSYNKLTGIGGNYSRGQAQEFMQGLIDTYGAGSYASDVQFDYDGSILKNQRRYILIDYSKLNNIQGADDAQIGYENTKALYNAGGNAASLAFETTLSTTLKVKGDTSDDPYALHKVKSSDDYHTKYGVPAEEGTLNDLSGILTYVLKKNRYYLYVKADNETKVFNPVFKEEDLQWYLPAYGQFTYFVPDPNIPGDDKANYWSSTAVDGASEAYIGDGSRKDRDLEYRVIAVRKDENNYGATTATVDNSSLAGGDNGSTNNWL